MKEQTNWGLPADNGTNLDGEALRAAALAMRAYAHMTDAGILIGNRSVDLASLNALLEIATRQLPRTRAQQFWHVEYWNNADGVMVCIPKPSEEEAKAFAIKECMAAYKLCLRITGPHKHLVPVPL